MTIHNRQEGGANPRRSLQQLAPLLIFLLSPPMLAANEGTVGEHGVLHISGSLTESACRLDMTSAYQAVDMGNVGTAQLQRAGDQAAPVRVQLRLQDCLRGASNQRDKLGNLTWSASMPSVSFNFTGAHDPDNPALLQAAGVGGMGLRMTDQDRRDVGLGLRGQPLLLNPGNDLLTYYIIPERTAAPLQAGVYNALVMFRLNYE
ncbi:fimbrial protein [Pseudomonas fluorescens]|uniref:fimbrial protein n=1 Tax=Pseudomonas fluorescens TaxID=294 RepID=UPI001BE7157C|nr:fimbrial protein [Pseudomonas fluorescens]MBT2372349.1 type 1 fimbrial protein [Pseudomonas fluorescens]